MLTCRICYLCIFSSHRRLHLAQIAPQSPLFLPKYRYCQHLNLSIQNFLKNVQFQTQIVPAHFLLFHSKPKPHVVTSVTLGGLFGTAKQSHSRTSVLNMWKSEELFPVRMDWLSRSCKEISFFYWDMSRERMLQKSEENCPVRRGGAIFLPPPHTDGSFPPHHPPPPQFPQLLI